MLCCHVWMAESTTPDLPGPVKSLFTCSETLIHISRSALSKESMPGGSNLVLKQRTRVLFVHLEGGNTCHFQG